MSAYPGDEIIARTISEKNDDPLFLFVSIGHLRNTEILRADSNLKCNTQG
jgi:hypothetical protein